MASIFPPHPFNLSHFTLLSGLLLRGLPAIVVYLLLRLNLTLEKPASNATHEPHNHQNHNNCSDHTHT